MQKEARLGCVDEAALSPDQALLRGKYTSPLIAMARIAVYLIAIAHICVIFVAGMPRNALRSAMQPFLRSYTSPVLTQSWSLFAPNPSRVVETLWIREDSPSARYRDVNDELSRPIYRNRLLPSALTLETYSHALSHLARYHDDRYSLSVVERTAACVSSGNSTFGGSYTFRLRIERLMAFRTRRMLLYDRVWPEKIGAVSC